MARYHEIAEDLRARIKAGEWKIGDKLPGIAALQEHYRVERSLGTIRNAQQLLVADGMLRTEQGVGAFVIRAEPEQTPDAAAIVGEIRDLANKALGALMESEFAAKRAERAKLRTTGQVTIDLTDGDGDHYYVLSTALQEFASRNHAEAHDAPDDQARTDHRQWAEVADRLRAEIDAALNDDAAGRGPQVRP